MSIFRSLDLDVLEKLDPAELSASRLRHRLILTLDDAIEKEKVEKAQRVRVLLKLTKRGRKRLTLQSMMDTPIDRLNFDQCAPLLKEIAIKAEASKDFKRAEQAKELFKKLLTRDEQVT